jgi:peptidoglycan/xylan/chitin deacetylase (PgdA/CDA1 family)
MGVNQRLVGLLGSRAISDVAIRATSQRLRIVAYHGIPDTVAFERHLIEYAERFTPVPGERVAAGLASRTPLPDRAVWLTFDDGHPEVEVVGRPLLEKYGITATMYVCPGVIDTDQPFWWETVREAERLGLTRGTTDSSIRSLEAELKTVPDADRRAVVAELTVRIEERLGRLHEQPQLSTEQIRAWVDAGQEVGNHSWDHPLLDRCSEVEQRRQVRDAHDWLAEVVAPMVWSFAYPNGNWAAATEADLQRFGYITALGFDHRLARTGVDALRLSRLRLDTDAEGARLRAVASGIQPALMGWRALATGPRRSRRDPRVLPAAR